MKSQPQKCPDQTGDGCLVPAQPGREGGVDCNGQTLQPTGADQSWVIRQSAIHGCGIFANRPIRRGERILEYVGERITKAEAARRSDRQVRLAREQGGGAVFIFELNTRWDIDGDVPWNPARLINHSCDPNCEAWNIHGHIWICARRNIAPGEELTYNYGFDLEHWEEHPCRCGAPNCVGHIVHPRYWRKLRELVARRRQQGGG